MLELVRYARKKLNLNLYEESEIMDWLYTLQNCENNCNDYNSINLRGMIKYYKNRTNKDNYIEAVHIFREYNEDLKNKRRLEHFKAIWKLLCP